MGVTHGSDMTKSRIVYLCFLAFTLLSGIVSWMSLKNLLYFDPAAKSIFLVAGAFLALISVIAVAVTIFGSLPKTISVMALAFGLFFIFFGIEIVYLVIFVLGLGVGFIGVQRAFREKRTHIKIDVGEICRPAASAVLTVLALIISSVVYFSPPAQNFAVEFKVPRIIFNAVTNSASELLGQKGIILPANEKKFASVEEIFTPEAENSIYDEINNQLNSYLLRFKKFLPYGVAVVVFLSLRTLGFIFSGLAFLIAKTVVALLKRLKVVVVNKEMVEREIIEI